MAKKESTKIEKNQFTERLRAELKKLTGSINEIMHNMKMMQNPIMESRERLPKANEQLGKISAQTEKATHTMLDMVEQILEHQEKIMQFTGDVTGFFKKSRSKYKNVHLDHLARIKEMASISQNNAFLIMDALQFQDITSQQMRHASTLLEDIENRLQYLLAAFEGKEVSDIEKQHALTGQAYDPEADLFNGKNQGEVDSIVSTVAVKD
ncbi:MAG: protein phosphatase CheZ [candidate division Zixibacteria bacterium]